MMDLDDAIRQHNESLTLQDLQDGNNALMFRCSKCGTTRTMDLAAEIQKNGAQTRVSYIRRTAQCPYCG